MKNAPIMNSTYGPSLKALHSTHGPAFLGFRRGLRTVVATPQIISATNPDTLTAHPNPTFGMRYWMIAGNMTLPIPVPVAAMANASALFSLKYELITVRGGINMIPRPKPIHTP